MGTQIVTLQGRLEPGGGADSFAYKLLGEPVPGRAYQIHGVTFAARDESLGDGMLVALHDGEIEAALLTTTTGGFGFTVMGTAEAVARDPLNLYWCGATRATGGGAASGYISDGHRFADFVTAGEQWIILTVYNADAKDLILSVEYEHVRMSRDEWTKLRRVSAVSDKTARLITS